MICPSGTRQPSTHPRDGHGRDRRPHRSPIDASIIWRRRFAPSDHDACQNCRAGTRTCTHKSGMPIDLATSALPSILLQKSFWGDKQNFLEPLMRFASRRRERPHRFIQNRPGTSVVALKSDTAAEKSRDQLSRDFPGRSIFDCCNNIPSEANIRARLQHVCFVPQQLTYLQTPICNRPL